MATFTLRDGTPIASRAGAVMAGKGLAFKSFSTTGTMGAASNSLVVASNPGFAVGDTIIVEIGGEAGAGARGTKGVGGVWPALSYANVGAMNADTGQATNTYAYLVDTGNTYQWSGSAWAQPAASQYYIAKAIPKALVTTITVIAGTTFTLAASSTVATTAANVYYDNAPVMNAAIGNAAADPHNLTYIIPAGTFAIGSKLWHQSHNGWTIKGLGKTVSTMFSPNGTPSAAFLVSDCDGATLRDFHLKGNAKQTGFGLSALVTQTNVPQGSAYPHGVFYQLCTGGWVKNVKVTDVFQQAVAVQYATDIWASDCDCVLTDVLRQYVQWMFQWADSDGGGFVDCTVDSPYLVPGFEIFRSDGVSMVRPVGTNATISVNASGTWLVDACDITIEANSQFDEASFSVGNHVLNVNYNIAPASDTFASGGEVRNPRIVQQGYINASNDSLFGVVVNADIPNVSVTGTYPDTPSPKGYIEAPNYAAPSTRFGAAGVISDSAVITVFGIRVKGTSGNTYPNIKAVGAGTVTNCVADEITCSTQSNNQTNAAWEAGHP